MGKVVRRSVIVAVVVLRAVTVVLVGLLLAAGTIGCGQTNERMYVTQQRMEAGLVVSLDGIGGYNWGPRWLRSGLDEAGCTHAIVIYDWSKGWTGMWVGDLMDRDRNLAAARDLAHMIASYKAAMPDRPVTIIGHSGGAAVVVWALESMPDDCKVDRAILLAPALSPNYDLSKALRAVRSRLYVMYSHWDVGTMGAGTALIGTMDRKNTVSAGLVGFNISPECAELEQYGKVRQVEWTADLMKVGNWPGHMGWTSTRFAREFIAPIIAGKTDPGQPLVPVRPEGGKAAAKTP
jgi:pimeloyl-ACP methyl ester carboxylesterase